MDYVLEHFDDLVLKDVAEAGGYGVVFGNTMTAKQKGEFQRHIPCLHNAPLTYANTLVIRILGDAHN